MNAFGLARIGRDCELRDAGSSVVTNIDLAFSGRYKGDKVTTWVEGALFGKRAEVLVQYLRKGKAVSVTLNNLREERYTKQDGTAATKLIGDVIDIELCPDGVPQTQAPPPAAPRPAPRPAAVPPARTGFEDMDSDIPF